MSRGRRTQASGTAEAAPRQRRGARRTNAAWRLAAALGLYAAVSLLLRWELSLGFGALFRAWNVNGSTVSRAPGWARYVYSWHGSAITLAVNVAVIALSMALSRRWARRRAIPHTGGGQACLALLAGLGIAVASAALFMLTDSIRPLWPLSRPHLSPGLAALAALGLLTVLAEELFTKRLVYALAGDAWGRPWATAIATAVFFFANGGYAGNLWCAVNVALLGALCCVIYARHGLAATVAFRWGWSFASVFLLGYGGGSHAVYRLYGVSESLLTGGDAGFVYGLWLTLVFAAPLALPHLLASRGRRGEPRKRAQAN